MQPDHYEILGLAQTATPEEIKKKYRTLARRYHPDVNPNADAERMITRINEAYHILGDADRRALYDAERMLRSHADAAFRASSKSAARPDAKQASKTAERPASRPAATRPAAPKSAPYKTEPRSGGSRSVEYNGFGTVPNANPAAKPAAKSAPKAPDTVRVATEAIREMERHIMEAQLAFINRQYREAEALCFQALQVDRRNATAHEILGDIFVKRGQTDNAVKAYTYAAQYNTRNLTVQAKLERLSGGVRRPSTGSGPTLTHASAVSPWEQMLGGTNRESALAAISGLFSVLFLGLCYLLCSHPGHPFTDSVGWLSDISFNLLGAFALGGALAGSLLAINGRMRPIQDELLARGTLRGDERSPISLGIVLTGFAILWFYASLLVYIGIAVAKNRLSLSILRAYGLTVLLTALFAFFYQSGYRDGPGEHSVWLQAFAIGGNITFPALLFGWAVGDALRLKDRV